MKIDELLLTKSGWKKFTFIIGGLCFVGICTSVIIYYGFYDPQIHRNPAAYQNAISLPALIGLNLGLGLIGGLLLDLKNPLISALSGLVASVLMTGASMLYFSWRTEILTVEIILPMLTGLVGKLIHDKWVQKKGVEDSSTH